MEDKKLYVPVLKWKKGEEEALLKLSDKNKKKITPLIEVTDYKEPDEIFQDLNSVFSYPVYIDTLIAAEDDRDYLVDIISYFKLNHATAYPVVYFEELDEILDSIKDITDRLAIKVSLPEDVDGPDYAEMFEAIKSFKLKSNMLVDIILDLGIISEKSEANRQFSELKQVLTKFFLGESFYNSIIICSTSFPKDISTLQAGQIIAFNRYDIKLFKKIVQYPAFNSLKNCLVYSDYGVTKFTDSEIDFTKLKNGILPKVKYTTDDEYIVLKGKKNTRTKKLVISYVDLSNTIINAPYYYKQTFSFGDLEIYERAKKIKGPGNSKNWVSITANHHITVVVEQLSMIP